MNKFTFLICFFLAGSTFGTAYSEPPVTSNLGVDTSDEEGILITDADFWIGPPDESSSMVLLIVSQGRKVRIKSEYKNYYEVWHRNLIGYIDKSSIKVMTTPETQPKTPPKEVAASPPATPSPDEFREKGVKQLYEVTKATSLRAGPDSKTRVLLRFRSGDRVEVLESSGYWWWKVRYQGKTGWAKRALLEK